MEKGQINSGEKLTKHI